MSVLLKRKRGRPRLNESREINDFDVSLIDEVKKFPIFYDKDHPHYRNREYTERIWESVADSLNVSTNVVKNRMFQLRNRYNVEKRRMVTLQHQQPAVCSSWPLYDSLQFLSEFNASERHYSLPANSNANEADTAITSSEAEDDDDDEDEEKKEGSNRNERNGYITNDNIDLMRQSELLPSPAPATEECHFPMPVVTQMDTNTEVYSRKFEAFGQFLASSLIEMDEMQALHLVKKFTADLVEFSKLGEGNKISGISLRNNVSSEHEHEQLQQS